MEKEWNSERFEKKLLNLKDTQDSITGLSKWCISKRAAHKQIVRSWLKIVQQVKIESRLTLFYLANDVIQHSKRRNYEFVDSWGTSLQKATTLVRDDKVKEKISRIFKIWEQREIYSEEFIADLHGLLAINTTKKQPAAPAAVVPAASISPDLAQQHPRSDDLEDEFQLNVVVTGIRNCVTLESETDKNFKIVVKTNVPDMEKTRNNLKDRTHVDEVERDIENASKKYELFMESLEKEVKARKILLSALDQADRFYRNQRRDVKKVVYAYKNFGDRIKTIQSELNAKIPNLTSPIPSPDINAPSPEPDNDDFDLPNDMNFYNATMNGLGSFLNSDAPLPFDLNEFYRESPPPPDQSSIQVIYSEEQNQSSAPITDFYNSLIPSKLEGYNPEMSFSNYQPSQPPLPSGPPMSNYQLNTPAPYMIAPPPPPSTFNTSQMDYSGQPPMQQSKSEEYSWNRWNPNSTETPHSPPHFERKGDRNAVEYIDDSLRIINEANDVDHRQASNGLKDVDHRNLISLTGSPGRSNNSISDRIIHATSTNGNDFLLGPPPPQEPPPIFNKFLAMSESIPGNFQPHMRNQRPPLLPTPSHPPRYNRNMSMNSDSSRGMGGPDDIESVDMEMSDDDMTGIDNRSAGSSGDNMDFSNPNMFPLPHQVSMNRPPPMMSDMSMEMNHQRKSWINNRSGNDPSLGDDESMNQMSEAPPSLLGIAPPNFMPVNHRFQGPGNNFRGNRGGNGIRGGAMNVNNSFRGRGIMARPRGRGFRGRGQW